MSVLEREFRVIYEECGILDLDVVHDLVADPAHPLHGRYEWDDTVAAREYRKLQIADDIRTLKVQWEDSQGQRKSSRAYLSRREAGEDATGYISTEDAIKRNPRLVEHLEKNCELEVKALRRRYSMLSEFSDILRRNLGDLIGDGTAA